MTQPRLSVVGSTTVNRTVTPRRRPNADLRTREYLTPDEVEMLIEAVRNNRHGRRDATMILVAYRHGLRAAELVIGVWPTSDAPRTGPQSGNDVTVRSSATGMSCRNVKP